MKTSTTTIDGMLIELSLLGYRYFTIDCIGLAHPSLPDWKARAVPSEAGWQPTGEGDTPTAAVQACLADAIRACLDTVRAVQTALDAVRAASEVAS